MLNQLNIPQPSLSELSDSLRHWGYILKRNDGNLEAHPKRKRGPLSIFEPDASGGRYRIRRSVEAAALANFKLHIADAPISDEIRDALHQWFTSHGISWKDALNSAWFNGNYGEFSMNNVSSLLQSFRNTTGHDVLRSL